jgi:CheY-like chemotaxis protein
MSMSRKKVLWADDEIDYLRSHIMFLETRGYSVTPVYSGEDAIHLIQQDPKGYDIVLLDEQMIGKDGLTTLEEIKEFMPEMPVVMVTKSEEEHVMEDAMGKKIDGYLTKPVNPSQILSVCKKLLDSKQILSSQIANKYGRSYSEMRLRLQDTLSAHEWVDIYKNLFKWDMELETVQDEGIRQTHAGQKSEAGALFANFIADNYVPWTQGLASPPVLTPAVLDTVIAPMIKRGENVCLFVFDSMRLDHYLAIEPLLNQYFAVERSYYYSILPSSSAITRKALLSGLYPDDIAQKYPKFQPEQGEAGPAGRQIEEKLLLDKMASWGLSKDQVMYIDLVDVKDGQKLQSQLEQCRSKRMVVINVNFINMLIQSHSSMPLLKEIAPDESAFRRLTYSWFEHATLLGIIRELSQKGSSVVVTSTNGCVLATRSTELYGAPINDRSLRYRIGANITSDERYALFISEPRRFRLPVSAEEIACIILKENYYFTSQTKTVQYEANVQNSFQQGGISMEELIMPLTVLRPRS